jgi:hypothetical protein
MRTDRNPITGDLLKSKTNGNEQNFSDGWDAIWKNAALPSTPINSLEEFAKGWTESND